MWLSDDRDQPQVFCIAGIGGLATFSFRGIADHLEGRASLVGIQLPGIGGGEKTPDSVQEIARWAKNAILTQATPGTPIRIAGYSAGGVIAIEAARLLREEGHELSRIILIDTLAPVDGGGKGLVRGIRSRMRTMKHGLKMRRSLKRNAQLDSTPMQEDSERRLAAGLAKTKLLLSRHVTDACPEALLLLNSLPEGGRARRTRSRQNVESWRRIATGNLETISMSHPHIEMMNDGSIEVAEVVLKEIGRENPAD